MLRLWLVDTFIFEMRVDFVLPNKNATIDVAISHEIVLIMGQRTLSDEIEVISVHSHKPDVLGFVWIIEYSDLKYN